MHFLGKRLCCVHGLFTQVWSPLFIHASVGAVMLLAIVLSKCLQLDRFNWPELDLIRSENYLLLAHFIMIITFINNKNNLLSRHVLITRNIIIILNNIAYCILS